MGCILEILWMFVTDVIGWLIIALFVKTWPGLLSGIAAGWLVIYIKGYHSWPIPFWVFLIVWLVVGISYWIGHRDWPKWFKV